MRLAEFSLPASSLHPESQAQRGVTLLAGISPLPLGNSLALRRYWLIVPLNLTPTVSVESTRGDLAA